MEILQLQAIIEGALLAAGEPLSLKKLETLFEDDEMPEKAQFEEALQRINESCQDRGFELKEIASGWRLQVREELAPWINRLWEEKPQRYSRALLETLALIAYRQPITRGDIEEIRGVAVSSHIIKTLTEREWVKVVGQRDVPGRPSLYATTRQFLDYFNLKSLDQLPTLSEIRDIDEMNSALDLGGNRPAGELTEEPADRDTDVDLDSDPNSALQPQLSTQDELEPDAQVTVQGVQSDEDSTNTDPEHLIDRDDNSETIPAADTPGSDENNDDINAVSPPEHSHDDGALASIADSETESDERSV
ncbi:SMC-Scp complex subunit ScpB [Gilvimarinus sp. 2_MG-2023]|uniref:SMC-Scp complex subunit ScpB n=1 Tax=Gilvimarinus sp. 2_MG-2023 TaxID=3062666 RepID=UPI0026E11D0F|nr:SMC-Scp complex subunit ScpB [Gilvimarinus sp. 2_MG-2023]MDO6570005.1 SMC-Scp complex subunit ScpB [Gilvimarinus sp. 2_MG-2023]